MLIVSCLRYRRCSHLLNSRRQRFANWQRSTVCPRLVVKKAWACALSASEEDSATSSVRTALPLALSKLSNLIDLRPCSSVYRRTHRERKHRHTRRCDRRPARRSLALYHRAEGEARRDGAEVLCGAKGCGEERGARRPWQVSHHAMSRRNLLIENAILQ
jgi:hypothetical protein